MGRDIEAEGWYSGSQKRLEMEIFGGFMVMIWMLGFFLTVIWFILPFVIFSIKGKVDRTVVLVEQLDARLKSIEQRLQEQPTVSCPPHGTPPCAAPQSSEQD